MWGAGTCFTWAWYEGVAFPTNDEYGRNNLLTKTRKCAYTEPIAWAERLKRLWVTYTPSDSTVTPHATALTLVHTHQQNDSIATGECRGTLVPPLSLYILLRHHVDAYYSLREHLRAQGQRDWWCTSDPHFFPERQRTAGQVRRRQVGSRSSVSSSAARLN